MTKTKIAITILLAALATPAAAWNKPPADTPARLKGKNVIEGRVSWFLKLYGLAGGKPYFFVDKGISESQAKSVINTCKAQADATVSREMDLYGTIWSDVSERHHSCLNRHGVHVLYRGPDNKLTVYQHRDLLQEF